MKKKTNVFGFITKAQKARIVRDIKKCFKGVDWSIQTFCMGDRVITDKKGREKFYAIGSIDEAIEKLNKLLNKLSP